MFKLEFDPANKPLALAMGTALVNYASSDDRLRNQYDHCTTDTGRTLGAPEVVEKTTARVNDGILAEREPVKPQEPDCTPATDQPEAEPQAEPVQQDAAVVPDVDKNGVKVDYNYCAKAAKPFYSSGKYAGQWKKGTKVTQEEYDEWYFAQRGAADQSTDPVEQYDTSNAFAAKEEATNNEAPQGIGQFIMWTAEQQTAGHLTQDDITEAYTLLGISQADISPANPNAQANITGLHSILSAKVSA